MEGVKMSDITEIINTIEKSWGVNSIGSPFGSCTEKFANEKMIEIANKNNFPDDVLKLIKANPIKFHKCQKFDNGRGIGRYYANLVRQLL
jgi:hypothetical protein